MLDMIELVKPDTDCGEIRYIFFDTGLEYDTTLRHITETEQKYGVTIERIKPKKSIPAACREHGIPFICKDASEMINRLQRHGFAFMFILSCHYFSEQAAISQRAYFPSQLRPIKTVHPCCQLFHNRKKEATPNICVPHI